MFCKVQDSKIPKHSPKLCLTRTWEVQVFLETLRHSKCWETLRWSTPKADSVKSQINHFKQHSGWLAAVHRRRVLALSPKAACLEVSIRCLRSISSRIRSWCLAPQLSSRRLTRALRSRPSTPCKLPSSKSSSNQTRQSTTMTLPMSKWENWIQEISTSG